MRSTARATSVDSRCRPAAEKVASAGAATKWSSAGRRCSRPATCHSSCSVAPWPSEVMTFLKRRMPRQGGKAALLALGPLQQTQQVDSSSARPAGARPEPPPELGSAGDFDEPRRRSRRGYVGGGAQRLAVICSRGRACRRRPAARRSHRARADRWPPPAGPGGARGRGRRPSRRAAADSRRCQARRRRGARGRSAAIKRRPRRDGWRDPRRCTARPDRSALASARRRLDSRLSSAVWSITFSSIGAGR